MTKSPLPNWLSCIIIVLGLIIFVRLSQMLFITFPEIHFLKPTISCVFLHDWRQTSMEHYISKKKNNKKSIPFNTSLSLKQWKKISPRTQSVHSFLQYNLCKCTELLKTLRLQSDCIFFFFLLLLAFLITYLCNVLFCQTFLCLLTQHPWTKCVIQRLFRLSAVRWIGCLKTPEEVCQSCELLIFVGLGRENTGLSIYLFVFTLFFLPKAHI